MATPVRPTEEGISLSLYVQPGAAKSGWAGLHDVSLKLRVAARPVEGEANKEVCAYLAKFFVVAKSAVTIVHGASGRNKIVRISGNTVELLKKAETLIQAL
jgi:uncharacterized protein (TIGR00251 family)